MTERFPEERLAVFTLAERPDFRAQLFSAEFAAAVPEFLRHDPTAALYYDRRNLDRYLGFVLAAVDRGRWPGRAARGRPRRAARPGHRPRGQRAVRVRRRHRGSRRLAGRWLGRGDPLGVRGLARRTAAERGQRARNHGVAALSRPRPLATDADGDA